MNDRAHDMSMHASTLQRLAAICAIALLAACGSSSSDDADTAGGGTPDAGVDTVGGDDTSAGEDAAGTDAGDAAADDADAAADAEADAAVDVPEPPQFVSRLRIIHLGEDTPPLTLFLDGQPATDDGAFDDIGYLEIGPGTGSAEPFYSFPTQNYEAALVPTGEPLSAALYTAPWNFSPDAYYTVFVFGDLDGEGDRAWNVSVTVDDTSVEAEATRIRGFNLIRGAGAVDVVIGAETVFEGLDYGAFMIDYILAAAPATYTVGARQVSTGDILVQQSVDFAEETKNVYFIGDAASGNGLGIVLLNLNNELQLLQE